VWSIYCATGGQLRATEGVNLKRDEGVRLSVISNKGILGSVSGTVGTVIGSSWRSIYLLKSRPGKRKGLPTLNQLMQQAKFLLISKFLFSLSGLIKESFSLDRKSLTGNNQALSYNLTNAVTGDYPGYEIDYSKVRISEGVLTNADGPAAISTEAGKIKFTWSSMAGVGSAKATDTAVLVLYCPDKKIGVFSKTDKEHAEETATITINSFSGKKVHTWLTFIAEDGKTYANSEYAGEVTVL